MHKRIVLLLAFSIVAAAHELSEQAAAEELAALGGIVVDLLEMRQSKGDTDTAFGFETPPADDDVLRVDAFVTTNLAPDASQTIILLWETSGADWVTLEHDLSFLIGVGGYGILARELPPDGLLTVWTKAPGARKYRIRAHNNIQQGAPTAVSEPITVTWTAPESTRF